MPYTLALFKEANMALKVSLLVATRIVRGRKQVLLAARKDGPPGFPGGKEDPEDNTSGTSEGAVHAARNACIREVREELDWRLRRQHLSPGGFHQLSSDGKLSLTYFLYEVNILYPGPIEGVWADVDSYLSTSRWKELDTAALRGLGVL